MLIVILALVLLTWTPAAAELAVVLNSLDDDVSLVDTTTYQQVRRLKVGKEPHHLMVAPDDRDLVVANAMSNDLVVLDPRTGEVVRRIPRISDPYQIGFSPDRRWFVATSLRLDRVDIYRFDGRELALAARLPVGRSPSHLAFSSDSRTVYATVQDSNQLVAIDLERHVPRWTVATGRQPAGAWMTPGDTALLVGLTGSNAVVVHDPSTGKELKRLVTGKGAHNFLAVGDGRRVLVSNRVGNTVSVIDQVELPSRADPPRCRRCVQRGGGRSARGIRGVGEVAPAPRAHGAPRAVDVVLRLLTPVLNP
jgi:YVTN family beta-propeller protein